MGSTVDLGLELWLGGAVWVASGAVGGWAKLWVSEWSGMGE